MQGIFEKAAPFYENGLSLREISKKLDVPKTSLRKALIEGGVVLRDSNRGLTKKDSQSIRRHIGVAPYGYCVINGLLVEVPKEQETVKLVMQLKSAGRNLTAIAKHLNSHKIKTRSSGKWDHSIVRSIINRYENFGRNIL